MGAIVYKNYKIVQTEEQLLELFHTLRQAEIVALDVESTGLNVRRDKIIGASFTTAPGNGWYLPVWSYVGTSEEHPESKEIAHFRDCAFRNHKINKVASRIILGNIFRMLIGKKLITHNGAYDTSIILYDYGIDLTEYIWIETTLAVHTVQEEGAFGYGNPFALKSIAIMVQDEIGLDVDRAANEEQLVLKENVKKNGGSITKGNFEIWKADLDVLAPYAVADTDLTFRIAQLFLKRIINENLTDFFFTEEVMPVYREVTIPMERRGIMLDIPLMQKTDKEIIVEIDKVRKEILEELLEQPETQQWIIREAFTVKYPPNHRGKYATTLATLKNINLPTLKSGKPSLANKNLESLPDSPYKKFLQGEENHGIPEGELLQISLHLWREENEGELVNINSKKQMGEIVFDFMGIAPESYTKKGQKQFDDNFIEKLSKKFKWAEKLRVHNRLTKIKSTYIDRILREQEEGIFYPYFKQHGTVSGRYGSNLQQLPKPKEEEEDDPIVIEYNNRIRAFFIARPGYIFIDTDYEQLEAVIFASVSDDYNLQEIFNKGHDFYSTIAIRSENLKGVSADKKADNYLKKVDPVKRSVAKVTALSIPYGASAFAVAMSLGISAEAGKELRDGYLRAFPGVSRWMEDSVDFFHEYGVVINQVGRVRHLQTGKKVYDNHPHIMDYRYRQLLIQEKGEDYVKKIYGEYKNAAHSATNFQIQSLAASIVNRSALQINRAFKERNWDGIVVAQIHDQLVVEIKKESYVEEAKLLKQKIMEGIIPLKGVKLSAPAELAYNFKEGHG